MPTLLRRGCVILLLLPGVWPILPSWVRGGQEELLEITRDTVLDPNRTYGRLVIRAPHVTIDGRGALVLGARAGNPAKFTGTGILAEGVSHVTVRNLRVRGWETGLAVRDGAHWLIEGCDFSDNFHDPKFGWGENGRRGGMLLERVSESTIRGNRANRIWDACVLVDSHRNVLEGNNFSHTSNTCLKLWAATGNRVVDNDLSYGIRKDPGEVHARDSTCMLLESGSNGNRFVRNDCRHGGDGIFIRVLNGWGSTDNVFEENDCSYANNNCVEAWSPRNTYLRNKANHGSYGFWLGASDQTILIGNEASENGLPDGYHNSPHLPDQGHAGIVFMFGPSSHTVVRDNTCTGNNGAGIALIGDLESQGQKWKAYHWIIEQNHLAANRSGVYMQYADWIDLGANRFVDNRLADVFDAGNVTRLTRRALVPGVVQPPRARLRGPSTARVGQPVAWDASTSDDPAGRPLHFHWDLGDGTRCEGPRVEHVYRRPGFYRLGITIDNGALSDLAWRDMYVTEGLEEIGTEGALAGWSWVDPGSTCRFAEDRATYLCGQQATRATIQPYSGGRVTLTYRLANPVAVVGSRDELVFWLRLRNENVPAWQGPNPLVTLVDGKGREQVLVPGGDFLSSPPYNEAREGWFHFQVALAGNERWTPEGTELGAVHEIRLGFDSWGAPPLTIWIDGLGFRATGK